MKLIVKEKKTVSAMIRLYCRSVHGGRKLCAYCRNLEQYSLTRLDLCVYGNKKPACKQCPLHCYSMLMRQEIKKVMQYSGPRMLMKHPLLTISHILREKRKVSHRSLLHWRTVPAFKRA